MPDMKPSLFRAVLICPVLVAAVSACSPSPYYTGTKSLAPGAVPRDGLGRPVIDGKAIVYDLPPAPPKAVVDIAGRPVVASGANQIIYFEDLRYGSQQRVANADTRSRETRP